MTSLLLAVAVYTTVFALDYVLFRSHPDAYAYVSRRTYALFVAGQVVLIVLFWPYFEPFFAHIFTEILFVGIFFLLAFAFCYALTREKLLICRISRSERCLTPGYITVKGGEILFQQLTYALIALTLVPLLGTGFYAYLAYLSILLIMHTAVVLSMDTQAVRQLTFGIIILSAPLFYIYTSVGYIYPAVYLHGLLYVYLWLTFADWN